MTAGPNRRIHTLSRHLQSQAPAVTAAAHLAVPSAATPSITIDPETQLGYADLELGYRTGGKGPTPARRPGVISDGHFRKRATEYDRKPGII
jgi:hypothetical protein